jgi:uncharacterized coiled-coil DUF342 family protein
VFDWLKDRARLLAEAREAREQAVLYADRLAAVDQERRRAVESLDAVTEQRDKAWARIKELRYERAVLVEQVGPVGSPPAFRTAAAELLAERARADQLAELVERLQEANLAAGCRHGIPLVEAGS